VRRTAVPSISHDLHLGIPHVIDSRRIQRPPPRSRANGYNSRCDHFAHTGILSRVICPFRLGFLILLTRIKS
jgi:hypothetical protein